jgi:hypothetical protein
MIATFRMSCRMVVMESPTIPTASAPTPELQTAPDSD